MSTPADPTGPYPDASSTEQEPTPFENVDVDEDLARDGAAPIDARLTDAEIADIERQVAEITLANQGRGPAEQISLSPEDVN